MKVPKPLAQLLAEIKAATQYIPPPPPSLFLDNIATSANGDTPHKEGSAQYVWLEEWSGIKQTQLPSSYSLSDEQVHRLLEQLKQLLEAYHCPLVFQKNLPERVQYRVIRERFNQKVPIQKDAYFSFSLCDHQLPKEDCIMGKAYCHCALMKQFFNKYSFSKDCELEEVDEFKEYILKKRYGEDWRKYLFEGY